MNEADTTPGRGPRFGNIQQAAACAGVTTRTIYLWMRRQTVTWKGAGLQLRIDLDTVPTRDTRGRHQRSPEVVVIQP